MQHFLLQCSYLFSCQDILVVTLPIAKFLSLFLQRHSCCNISFCDVPVFFPTRSFLSLYSSCKVPVFVPARTILLQHFLLQCSYLFSCQDILVVTLPIAKIPVFVPARTILLHHLLLRCSCLFSCQVILGDTFPAAKFLYLFLPRHSC